MEEAGVIVEGMSLTWVIIVPLVVFLGTLVVAVLIKVFTKTTEYAFSIGRFFALATTGAAVLAFSSYAALFTSLDRNHHSEKVSAVEEAYEVILFDVNGRQISDSSNVDLPSGDGHRHISFKHNDRLYTDALLESEELNDGSLRLTLMFNPDEDTDKMTEFSSELLSSSEGPDTERMEEVSTSENGSE